MTKVEILKRLKEKQVELCNEFIIFIVNEGFIQTIDKVGNFETKMPVFYKKVSKNIFLVFNIPTFSNIKKYDFHADFWKVIAETENEFLEERLDNKNLIAIRLSFQLDRDLNLLRDELSKY